MHVASALGVCVLGIALSTMTACAGSRPDAASSNESAAAKEADGGSAANDGGDERPFAASAAEATTLIAAAVDEKGAQIGACVLDFRVRKNLTRERVSVSFGIDMEGKLLGVASKGKEDGELKTCVHKVLDGVKFPRSHAGVITVTKTYEELLQ